MDEKDALINVLNRQMHAAIDAAVRLEAQVMWLEAQLANARAETPAEAKSE
jgi:hypothetical protein